eukprot:4836703-Pleurochrysis_carterae.AAC.2
MKNTHRENEKHAQEIWKRLYLIIVDAWSMFVDRNVVILRWQRHTQKNKACTLSISRMKKRYL